MILGYHIVFGCYGFWLPNDPRGSGSDFVRRAAIWRWGSATKVHTRRSVAHTPHDADARRGAKAALRHRPMVLTGEMAREVGRVIGEKAAASGYPVYALAVLPEHVHLVIGPAPGRIEQVVRGIKQSATQRLRAAGRVGADRPIWGRGCWKVYLNDTAAIRRAIGYVQANPRREGKPAQRWSCVTPFGGDV